jgi:hypothetical protein
MRPTHLLTASILACLLATPAFAAPNPREQWLVQTRAADAIGEVLMETTSRGEAQVDALREELAKAGEKLSAAPAKLSAARESQAAYRTLVDHVLGEIRRAGPGGEIDASLENLSDGQLFSEMAALQSYNLRTFRRFTELREQEAQVRRRLAQIGRGDAGGATTQPAIATADQLARDAVAALNRPQPSEPWAAARQKMRNAIATRTQQRRHATPASAASPFAPPANAVVFDDPRWQPYYYGPADPYSGGGGAWAPSTYGDPFEFRGGGGIYERFDSRVNVDFDTRTRAQPDRRVNVQFDRRLNMHVDPRANF